MTTLRARACLLLTCLLAAYGLAPHPATRLGAAGPATPRPNVIYIVVDSLRADHVSSYGYTRTTTPNLDTLAAQGARFDRAMSTSGWTTPANAANMTGFNPTSLNLTWTNWWYSLRVNHTTLTEYLHDGGYATAAFVANGMVSCSIGFSRGFDSCIDSLATRPHSDTLALPLTTQVITWTQQYTNTQPLFLFVYFMDPHTHYNPPPPYDLMYDSTYTGTLTSEVFGDGEPVATGQIIPSARDIEHIIALYDGEITYTDHYLQVLLDHLRTRGMLDNALIVFASDHGEQFGEQGLWVHANSVYEGLVHVPLLMSWPGVITPGLTITTPVQTMDLMPTILDLVGLAVPEGLDAVSLKPLLQGQPLTATHEIGAEVDGITDASHWAYWTTSRVDLRAIRDGDWKLIHHVSHIPDDALYQLQPVAPYEGENVIAQYPERAAEMRQALWNWFGLNRVFVPLWSSWETVR